MATNDKQVQRKADSKRAGKRTRAWACIVYPESAPNNWIEALKETHQEILISPLHDLDVTADGKPKKPHYHVLAMWGSPASEAQAEGLFSLIGVTAPPEMVRNLKGYARYLVHMDDHDKHRYKDADVIALGGASFASIADNESDHTDSVLMEIEDWIDEYGCLSYRALSRYARHERPDWYNVVRRNTIHLSQYLKSATWELSQSVCVAPAEETAEDTSQDTQ